MPLANLANVLGGGNDESSGVTSASFVNVTSSGAFIAADGTAAAPSYTFASDPDTGIYRSASNEVGVACGGVDLLRFAAISNIPSIYQSATNARLGIDTTGAIALTAGGTNQNVSLTPSGTGRVTSAAAATFGGPVVVKNYTVAGLPSAATNQYGHAFVTDATLTAITGLGLSPTGGGANKVPVYSDGTSWLML